MKILYLIEIKIRDFQMILWYTTLLGELLVDSKTIQQI